MKCSNCGRELEVGLVYCPKCGREVQIVSDHGILEDELLEVLLDKEKKEEQLKKEREKREQEKKERIRRKKAEEAKRKKKKRKKMILLVIILACVVAAVSVFFYIRKINSFSYLYEQAEISYNIGKYEDAQNTLIKALEREPDSEEAYLLLGKVCVELQQDDKAEEYFKRVIEINPDSSEAYICLLELYESQKDYDRILELRDSVPVSKETILKLFESFLVDMPEASVKSGTYNEPFEVELSAEKGLEIYYTLDGSDPIESGMLYENAIEFSEEGKIILKAVCKDEKDVYSEMIEMIYNLEFEVPDMPVAYPDGGRFTEASQVTLSSEEGTTIYYTWDESIPDSSSDKYTGPLDIPEGNNILSVIAVDNDTGQKSGVLRSNFIYYPE